MYITEIKIRDSEDIDYSVFPFSLPVVKHLDHLQLKSKVTFLVGENGTGKSTLLEAIAVNFGFNPEGGSRNFNFATKSTHSELYKHITLVKGVRRPRDGFFLRAESFYNVATEIERLDEESSFDPPLTGAYGGKSLHERSHGESFFSLVMNRFFGNGLYLLDEPEAALSPSRQMALLARIHDLAENNSQFIIATHSPILLTYPKAQIYVLSEGGITLTPYWETEHFMVTKQFINNPDAMLRHLL